MQYISTLICHSHVEMAISCLGRLLTFCRNSIGIRIHDDGTLTDEDYERLGATLDNPVIISTEEANDLLVNFLRSYPALAALRTRQALFHKLIDTAVTYPNHNYAFCDPDVLFLRPFLLPPNPFTHFIFIQDRQPSYSFRSWNLARSSDVTLPHKANTGFIMGPKHLINWDYLAWFVAQPLHHSIPYFLEQTAWAALGMKVGCRSFDPTQIQIMRDEPHDTQLVGGHFTERTRDLIPQYLRQSQDTNEYLPPVTLRTIPAGQCTSVTLAKYEFVRILTRLRTACRRIGF